MEEYRPVSNRTRFLFALVGLIACLIGGLCAEMALGRLKAGSVLARNHALSMVFATQPGTTHIAVPVTPPDAPTDSDLQRRLEKAGGQSGDVQISLAWNNNNDLDLSCIDPYGELIDGYNQTSHSGGVLDVDMNVTPAELLSPEADIKIRQREPHFNFNHRSSMSSEPVENLVWEHDAPIGHYKVFVHQFCNKEQSAETPFWVVVRVHNEVHRIAASVGREDFAENLVDPKLVYEFDVAPVARVAAPTAAPAKPAPVAPPPPRIVTRTAYSFSYLSFALLAAGIWGALIGLLPFALLVAQRLYLRLPPIFGEQDLIVGFGGPATGFAAGLIGQLLFSLLGASLAMKAYSPLFVMSWILFGCLFGGILSLYTPNISRLGGLLAGALSALAGGALFLPMAANHMDSAGRLLTAALIGGAIGALIALPEHEREPEPEPEPEQPRDRYEVQPPFVVRGTRTRKVGGLRQTGHHPDR